MATPETELAARMVEAHAAAQRKIDQRTRSLITALIRTFLRSLAAGVPREDAAAELAASLTEVAAGAVRVSAELARTHYADVVDVIGKTDAPTKPSAPRTSKVERAASDAVEDILDELDSGKSPEDIEAQLGADEGAGKVADRLADEVAEEAHQADLDEGQKAMDASGDVVIGYRRVIHPDASKGGTCGLCAAAATQFYSKGTKGRLKPIHKRCRCTVLPILKGQDVGWLLNKIDLEAVYRAAGKKGAPLSTDRGDLSNVRFKDL